MKFIFTAILVICLAYSKPLKANDESVVTYCIDPHWAPYEYIADNEHLGISKQYLKLISKYSGLTFQLYATETWQESITALKAGKCALIPFMHSSKERKAELLFSQSYFRASNVFYAKHNQNLMDGFKSLTSESIAVVDGYLAHDYMKNNFPELSIVTVNDAQSGLELLAQDKVDLFVGTFYTANQIVHNLGLVDIHVVGLTELDDKLHIGLNKNQQALLQTLERALTQLSPQDHRNVFSTLHNRVVISQIDYSLVWEITLVTFSIIVSLVIIQLRIRSHSAVLAKKNVSLEHLRKSLELKNKQLAELSIKDHLTGLFNRLYLSEHIEENIKLKKRYGTDSCLIILDIDNFKHFNDTFGHNSGDEVIKIVAKVLNHVCRDTDISARWGGEEFVILCPASTLNNAKVLASRFQHELSLIRSPENESVTCSIGIAELALNESFSQWFSKADAAMYAAKADGKNCIREG